LGIGWVLVGLRAGVGLLTDSLPHPGAPLPRAREIFIDFPDALEDARRQLAAVEVLSRPSENLIGR